MSFFAIIVLSCQPNGSSFLIDSAHDICVEGRSVLVAFHQRPHRNIIDFLIIGYITDGTERVQDIQMRVFIECTLAVIIGTIIPGEIEITVNINKGHAIYLPV